LQDALQDYAGYVRWTASLTGSTDVLSCIRRSTFKAVPYPDWPACELMYFHELAQVYLTRTCSEVVALVHNDAGNRVSRSSVAALLRRAPGQARSLELLLDRHGEEIRSISPGVYLRLLRMHAVSRFLSGMRCQGVRGLLQYLRRRPLCVSGLAILAAGLLGPVPMAWAVRARAQARDLFSVWAP